MTLGAIETVNGNIGIQAGTLVAGTTLNVAGNWSNSVGASGFTAEWWHGQFH